MDNGCSAYWIGDGPTEARHTFAFTVRVDRAHTRDATNRSFRALSCLALPCGGRCIHQHPTPTPLHVSARAQSTALHFSTSTTTKDCAKTTSSPTTAKKPPCSGSDRMSSVGCRYVFSGDVQSDGVQRLSSYLSKVGQIVEHAAPTMMKLLSMWWCRWKHS